MGIFILLAAVVIMIIGFVTIGIMNTLLVAASGAGLYYYMTTRTQSA
jgi:hypothetical protein